MYFSIIYKNNPTQDHNDVLDHLILPASTSSASSITRHPRIVVNSYSSEYDIMYWYPSQSDTTITCPKNVNDSISIDSSKSYFLDTSDISFSSNGKLMCKPYSF